MASGGRARLRAATAAVASLLLAAACSGGQRAGGDDGGEMLFGGDDEGTTTTAAHGDRPRAGDDRTTTTSSGRVATTTTTRRGSGGATSTTAGSGGGPSTTRAPSTSDGGARGLPGAYARTLLQPQRAERVVIEPLVQPGATPGQATLDHVAALLRQASGKPVVVASAVALPAGDGSTGDDEIRDLSDRHARTTRTAEQAVVRLLFLAGRYSPTTSVLGVAVRGDTAAVFPDQVEGASSPLVDADRLEQAVAAHELGHLLGLVDLVVDTGRDDPEHEGHSRNRDSVMYWAIESDLVGQVLSGPPPVDFDAADRADLAAIRNGG